MLVDLLLPDVVFTQQIQSFADLLAVWTYFEQPNNLPRIGIEYEQITYPYQQQSCVVPYGVHIGLHRYLLKLADRLSLYPEYDNGHLVALVDANKTTVISLEPGGQIEFSSRPHTRLALLAQELNTYVAAMTDVAKSLGIDLSVLPFNDKRRACAVPVVPKARYQWMQQYWPQRAQDGLNMMINTASVQVNLDFKNQAHASQLIRVAYRLSPYLSALFGRSAKTSTGPVLQRYHVWQSVDPNRCGLPAFMAHTNAIYHDYTKWALQVPVFGIMRQQHFIPIGHLSFESFIDQGFAGHRACLQDWVMHLGTLYPEIRLKKTIELRGADTGSVEHVLWVAAVWHGLLNDLNTLHRIEDSFPCPSDMQALQKAVAQHGLKAHDQDGPIIDKCQWILKQAQKGLAALGEYAVSLERSLILN